MTGFADVFDRVKKVANESPDDQLNRIVVLILTHQARIVEELLTQQKAFTIDEVRILAALYEVIDYNGGKFDEDYR